jgi:hypothetical protein
VGGRLFVERIGIVRLWLFLTIARLFLAIARPFPGSVRLFLDVSPPSLARCFTTSRMLSALLQFSARTVTRICLLSLRLARGCFRRRCR